MPLADRHCPPNKDRVDLGASQQVQRAPKSTSVWAQSDSHPLPNWRVPGDLHMTSVNLCLLKATFPTSVGQFPGHIQVRNDQAPGAPPPAGDSKWQLMSTAGRVEWQASLLLSVEPSKMQMTPHLQGKGQTGGRPEKNL